MQSIAYVEKIHTQFVGEFHVLDKNNTRIWIKFQSLTPNLVTNTHPEFQTRENTSKEAYESLPLWV